MISALNHWILNKNITGSYRGILFSDSMSDDRHSAEFVAHTTRALQLIEQVDPRRFFYTQREILYIVNDPLLTVGAYHGASRCCSIDFLRYRSSLEQSAPDYEWYIASYASVIVHEATHGRIYRFGIPYNSKTWERVERLCHKEQKRFTAHIESENYNFKSMGGEFDPIAWRNSRRMSRFQQIKKRLSRMREIEAADK